MLFYYIQIYIVSSLKTYIYTHKHLIYIFHKVPTHQLGFLRAKVVNQTSALR